MTRQAASAFGPAYGFGAYIHWPFCTRICPYCDFNVYAAKSRDPSGLLAAMQADIAAQHLQLSDHPPLDSIFFGGGTPSLLTGAQIELLIASLDQSFGLSPTCEITLEANPNNIDQAKANDWKRAGINRLSIGLQSLDDTALAFLGRDHNADDARRAVSVALDLFASVSIDMIYARPEQTPSAWEAELRAALALGAQHLSLYELTIEPATVFGKRTARGELTPLPDSNQAELYELTDEITQAAGLPAYEISNHAISARHRSIHNQIYWRSGDWLGIGPGAHGRLTRDGERLALHAADRPADYIADQTPQTSVLTSEDTAHEMLAMGLRPVDGVPRARIEQQFAAQLDDSKLAHLIDGGWLNTANEQLSLSPKGRLLADRVTFEIANTLDS
ncbi:MAG: radical SAM family heme chaperone HemW [Hyphomonadaceae bacterium]